MCKKNLCLGIGASLRKIYHRISAEGHDTKIRTNFDKDSELLDGLVDPKLFPSWLTSDDLDFYIKQFKNSGFRGPINRYRNQDGDWEKIPKLFHLKIEVPSFFIGGRKDSVRNF